MADGLRALVSGFFLAVVLLVLLARLLKDWRRAGLLVTVLLLSFFSYGQIYNELKSLGDVGVSIARHRFLLPFWLATTLVLLWWARRRQPVPTTTKIAANVVAVLLLIYPAFQISSFVVRGLLAPSTTVEFDGTGSVSATPPTDTPDIYYIIVDAYSRQDLLDRYYGFDNSEFVNQLRELGFYVADCSLSNYPKTRLSLTSSLNMDYLENLGITANDQRDAFWRLIHNNQVRKKLAAQGYKIVSLETGFYWTEWPDADVYLSREDGGVRLNGFEALLVQTTLLRAPLDLVSGTEAYSTTTLEGGTPEEHYEITRLALDALDDLAFIPGPKFVFAHLLIPHRPFVFDADGDYTREPRSLVESYNAQVTYLNKRLVESLTAIINKTERPVVIILQGDHGGPGTQLSYDRMKILNAYYMPAGKDQLYSSITPVNSFRVVFDTYFGTDFGLLQDLSYYSTSDDFFDVTLIRDDNPACLTLQPN